MIREEGEAHDEETAVFLIINNISLLTVNSSSLMTLIAFLP
jgi:hypothetical protein